MRTTRKKERRAFQSLMHTDILQEIKSNKCKCPYCGGNMIIRPASYINTKFDHEYMVCMNYPSCDSYARATKFNGQYELLSSPANKQLRMMRKEAHFWIDKLVETGICKTNTDAYYITSQKVSVQTGKMIHIGQCREQACKEIISACIEVLNNNRSRFDRFQGWYGTYVKDEKVMKMRKAISFLPDRQKVEI